MNKTFAKILALILALTLVFSFAACNGNTDGETTTTTTTTTAEADLTEDTSAEDTTDEADTSAEEPSEEDTSVEEDTAVEDTTVADSTTAKVEKTTKPAATTTKATTTKKATTTAKATTTKKAGTAPKSQAEILAYYNNATAKAVNAKAGFSKTRTTKEGSYEAGFVLNQFKGVVYQFMGIGAENAYKETIAKGNADYTNYFKKSTLTAADINSATIKTSGNNYVITISIKNGSSSITDGGNFKINAPVAKCGISAGNGDKGYYDHKNAHNIYDAIDDIAGGATIKESYSNAKAVMTVNATTGNIVSLAVTYDVAYDISNVMGSGGTATGSTSINYSNFKY